MIDQTVLHDLKRIADAARGLLQACDALYADLEEKSTGPVPTERLSFMDLDAKGYQQRREYEHN